MINQHQAASVPTRLSGRDAEVPCRGRRMNQNSLALRIRIVIALGPAVRLGGKDGGNGTRAPRSFFPVTTGDVPLMPGACLAKLQWRDRVLLFFPVIYRTRGAEAGAMPGKTAKGVPVIFSCCLQDARLSTYG